MKIELNFIVPNFVNDLIYEDCDCVIMILWCYDLMYEEWPDSRCSAFWSIQLESKIDRRVEASPFQKHNSSTYLLVG